MYDQMKVEIFQLRQILQVDQMILQNKETLSVSEDVIGLQRTGEKINTYLRSNDRDTINTHRVGWSSRDDCIYRVYSNQRNAIVSKHFLSNLTSKICANRLFNIPIALKVVYI